MLGRVFRPGLEIRVPDWVPGREIFPGRVPGLEFSNPGFGPGSGFHFEIFRVSGPGTRPVPIPASNYSLGENVLAKVEYRKKSILIYQDEVMAITQWGSQFYDGKMWQSFEMVWGDLEIWGDFEVSNKIHESIHLMVVHTQNGDHLFAFSESVGQ